MILSQLSIINFKNYDAIDLTLHPKINCFLGDNGSGKTTLLDAIYYLAFCKSFFTPQDSYNIKNEKDFFVLNGSFENETNPLNISCGVKKNQKKQFKFNKKAYERLADHIGKIPTVLFCPQDILLIIEGSETRRKFIDGIISQVNPTYLNTLIQYNKVLNQRNKILKHFIENRTFDADQLNIWSAQLLPLGSKIHQERKTFLKEFTPLFEDFYHLLSKGNEAVSLTYESHLNDTTFDNLLSASQSKDCNNGYTNVGPHKDDLILSLENKKIKKFASQGQQKTYLIALKLAQAKMITQTTNKKVILLIDDIQDKLDQKRLSELLQIVSSEDFGQLFITDTNPNSIPEILKKQKLDFESFTINQGQLL